MKVRNIIYQGKDKLKTFIKNEEITDENLLIQVFTGVCKKSFIEKTTAAIKSLLPRATIIGTTTAGEIINGEARENETVISFTSFSSTRLEGSFIPCNGEDSFEMGIKMGRELISDSTRAIIVFSDWSNIQDGVLDGLSSIDDSVVIAGGKAGDNFEFAFKNNYIFLNERVSAHGLVGVALNSSRLKVYSDYNLGWQKIGKKMQVTKSEGNRVYEIDGQSACDIYEKYLGEEIAEQLPQTAGPEFPLILKRGDTLIARGAAARYEDGSLGFGGEVPEGADVYLSYGHINSIIQKNINLSKRIIEQFKPEALFLYSCAIRKAALQENLNRELSIFKEIAPAAGFFTYGEFYSSGELNCLLNITLTALALTENDKKSVDKKEFFDKEKFAGRNERSTNTIKALTNLANTVTDELSKARDEAEKASRAKSEFLSNMSHEIRTPMNAITGLSELCLEQDIKKEKRDNYLRRINASAEYLLNIINDILDLSRIEDEKIELKEEVFELDEVLEKTWLVVAEESRDKPIEVLFSRPPTIPNKLIGDETRLVQILANLTKNALEYTGSGEIIIDVKMEKKEQDKIKYQFAVSDTGPGIPPEEQDNVFERFGRAEDSTSGGSAGAGLGLAIARQLVEMMKGEIWLESEPGEGSTFYFTAEFGRAENEDSRYISPPPDLDGLKVLVVDDNPSAREICEEYLRALDFHPEITGDGETALEKLEFAEEAYELLLLDWNLPGIDGLETLKKIMKKLEIHPKPEIIFVSAFDKEEIMTESGSEYISDFLTKPFSPSSLFDTIMDVYGYSGRDIVIEQGSELAEEDLEAGNADSLLLVEDNETNQVLAREILEGHGYEMDLAEEGREALSKIEENEYDCVLMDIQLPGLNGYEITRKIRDELKLSNLPVIALTANVMEKHRQEAAEAGMNDLISKPIDIRNMLKKIKQVIDESGFNSGAGFQSDNDGRNKAVEAEKVLDLDTINASRGLKRLEGDVEIYRKVLKKFAQNCPGLKEKLQHARSKADYDALDDIAHEIKGTAGNIGAENLQDKAGKLERSLGEISNTEDIEKLTGNLEQELTRTAGEINSLPERESAESESFRDIAISEFKSELQNIKTLIEAYDIEAADKIQDEMLKTGRDWLDESMRVLKDELAAYEFESALKQVKNINERLEEELE